jgi:hypothetical protein
MRQPAVAISTGVLSNAGVPRPKRVTERLAKDLHTAEELAAFSLEGEA